MGKLNNRPLIILLTVITVIFAIFLIYPKDTVRFTERTDGSFTGDTATVCKCAGISDNISNTWLNNYYEGNEDENPPLSGNEKCIGVVYACLITNKNIDFDFYQNNP